MDHMVLKLEFMDDAARQVRDQVVNHGVAELSYNGGVHSYLTRIDVSMSFLRRDPIDMDKDPAEIADLLNNQGFEGIPINDWKKVQEINVGALWNGKWNGYATFEGNPFGVFLPEYHGRKFDDKVRGMMQDLFGPNLEYLFARPKDAGEIPKPDPKKIYL